MFQLVAMYRLNDYNDTSDYNELFLAVHNGEFSLVNTLLEKYSAKETIRGKTLLHVAIARGHAEIAKTLLDNGATIGVEDINGNTPLDVSLATGNVPIAEILFNNGAVLSDNDLKDMRPLRFAARDGNFEMVKLLMANGCNTVDIPTEYGSSLQFVVSSGRLDILGYLLENGKKSSATINEDKLLLIRSHIMEGSLDTLRFLVDIGIKVQYLDDVFDSTYFLGRHDKWKYLVTRLSTINAKTYFKEKQLHFSIRKSQVETIKKIVNEPSNEYESDTFARQLAVYIAVESGSEEILKILLNAGYPVNDSVFKCISPLHLAATFEHPRLVKLLLNAGADVNLQTEDCGRTALHFAATAAQPTVVKFLLNNGADPSLTLRFSESPLKEALNIHACPFCPIPVTPLVFERLAEITEMLIQYSNSKTDDDLFYSAIRIRVSSSIENSKPMSRELMSVIGDSVFRPEIIRSIFNYLSEEEVISFTEIFFLEECGSSHEPPELLQLMLEYNIDSKSCSDAKIYTCYKHDKCQLSIIGYSNNVKNLFGSFAAIINDYDDYYYNDEEKKNIKTLLKLLLSRLILLNVCCDLTPFEESEFHDLIDWQENCEQEKIVMQRTKVDENLNFTFYDVLTKSIDKVAGYTGNEDFLTAMKSLEIKFPIYADFFKANVDVAERKRYCIDECTTLMFRVVKKCYKIRLSNSDIRHILQYLSIVDLRRFSASCS